MKINSVYAKYEQNITTTIFWWFFFFPLFNCSENHHHESLLAFGSSLAGSIHRPLGWTHSSSGFLTGRTIPSLTTWPQPNKHLATIKDKCQNHFPWIKCLWPSNILPFRLDFSDSGTPHLKSIRRIMGRGFLNCTDGSRLSKLRLIALSISITYYATSAVQ